MAKRRDQKERASAGFVPRAENPVEGLLSELLASPVVPLHAFEPPEPVLIAPDTVPEPHLEADETLAALSLASEAAPPIPIEADPIPALVFEPEPLAELVWAVEAEPTVTPAIVEEAIAEPEPEIFVPPAPPSYPETVEAQAIEPEPVALPSNGELDSLISTIDSEVAAAPLLDLDEEVSPKSSAARDKHDGCIVFSLDQTHYAVSIKNVLEMDKIPRITPVPNLPGFVRGVTNLRGEIVSVLDLRLLLGLTRSEQADKGRILVVRTASGQQTTALVVDDVKGITGIPAGALKPPAGAIDDKVVPLLSGVFEHEDTLLNVLSLESLFRSPELLQLEAN
jgi:purine-binding chemotaxis protein CheW